MTVTLQWTSDQPQIPPRPFKMDGWVGDCNLIIKNTKRSVLIHLTHEEKTPNVGGIFQTD